jgi:hypothetical protein
MALVPEQELQVLLVADYALSHAGLIPLLGEQA